MKAIQEIFEQCYKNMHPKYLAGDIKDLRFSAPQYVIDLLIKSDYYNHFGNFDKITGKVKIYGIEIVPCHMNEVTLFHLMAPMYGINSDTYYSVSL